MIKAICSLIAVLGLTFGAAGAEAGQAKRPAPGQRICGLYSSIILAPGEKAVVDGAGASSVSMTITGPGGSWIFYDGLSTSADGGEGSTLVLRAAGRVAWRRGFDARIYALRAQPERQVGGKYVEAMASGLDMMRQPLDHPAITGGEADLAVVDRVRPGEMSRCDLTWQPGKGLVAK